MRAEQIRFLFRDERRYPNRRLESACTDIGEHGSHVAAERRASLEPVAHCTLVAIVDLHVSEGGHGRRDDVEIVEHLLRGHAWPEAVPRTPAGRWRLSLQGWMSRRQPAGQVRQQARSIGARRDEEVLQ